MKSIDVQAFSRACRSCRSTAIRATDADPAMKVVYPSDPTPGSDPLSGVIIIPEPIKAFTCSSCGQQWEEVIRSK